METLAIDLDPVTGGSLHRGVTYLDGEIFVSMSGSGQAHSISVFDSTGSLLRSFPQPAIAQGTSGFNDGATDGTSLLWGFSLGISLSDENGVISQELLTQNNPLAGSGVPIPGALISGNVLNGGNLGAIQALAYDRSGNGGDGSFWVSEQGASIFEIDVNGDVLVSNHNVGEDSAGFGLDPVTGNLWINEGQDSALGEYDPRTGVLTGRNIDSPGAPGGLEIVPGSFTRGLGASGWDVLELKQTNPDRVRVRRLHLDVAGVGTSTHTRLGTAEPTLISTIDGAEFFPYTDNAVRSFVLTNSTLDWDMDISGNPGDGMGTGGLNGTPAVIFANLGVDAVPDASSDLVRELVHLNLPGISMPAASVPPKTLPFTMGNDPLNPSARQFALGVPLPVPVGNCIRMQAVYVDPGVDVLPLAMTNQVRFCRNADPVLLAGVYAEAIGENTFNADTSAGYFSVTNEETDPALSVVRLTVTILPPSPSATTQALFDNIFRFDSDNPSMAEVFEGGDSLVAACQGTYRNGSEVNTGLIFAGTNQQNASPCDATALQGWLGSDDGPSNYGSANGDWLTLTFSFSPDTFMNGAIFEFDADTDGGVGLSGNDMAGLVFEAELKNGTITSGELVSDPNNPTRGFAQL
jgi:hypothetical protein